MDKTFVWLPIIDCEGLPPHIMIRAWELGLSRNIKSLDYGYYYEDKRGKLDCFDGTCPNIPYNKELADYLNEETYKAIQQVKGLSEEECEILVNDLGKDSDYLSYYKELGGEYRPIIGGPLDGKCLVTLLGERHDEVLPSLSSKFLFLNYIGDIKFKSRKWCISIRLDTKVEKEDINIILISSNTKYVVEYNPFAYLIRKLGEGEHVLDGTEGSLERCQQILPLVKGIYSESLELVLELVINKVQGLSKLDS